VRQFTAVLTSLMAELVAAGTTAVAHAQIRVPPNQFGILDRADAAERLIVLATQQGISSLPPTSAQSFTYRFDFDAGNWVPSEQLGPISFRTPRTIGEGNFSVRIAGSYFQLSHTFAPILYQTSVPRAAYTKFGLQAEAKVGLLNFGFNYGVTNRVELNVNFPVVVNNTAASDIYLVDPSVPPVMGLRPVAGRPTIDELNAALATGGLREQRTSLTDPTILAVNPALDGRFNSGTHAGLGRISLGAKALLYSGDAVQSAFVLDFYAPSPSQDEFAGSDSPAILPRVVGAADLTDYLHMHADIGYQYDFDFEELRCFVWNVGWSVPLTGVTFDFGVGGSKFNQGIQWTPDRAQFEDLQGQTQTMTALQDNRLGDNFIDFLGGIKVRLTDHAVIGGAVTVPVNNQGFRPAALGTIAGEFYFR
jgi:hypothetical protein